MPEMIIPKIDPKVFRMIRQQVVQNKAQEVQNETKILPIIIGAKAYPDIPQGIELYYQNIPFPRKGFPDADIIRDLNVVKKDLVSYVRLFGSKYLIPEFIIFGLTPWKWKIKIIENFLEGINRKAYYWLGFWFYQPQYYCVFASEIKNVIRLFLRDIGISQIQSDNTALLFCMFMEHDDRYRLPVQDIFTAINDKSLIKNPRKELNRIKVLYLQREHSGIEQSFIAVFDLLILALYHPRIKKSFIKAIKLSKFAKLQFDEGDEYWACTWGNYDSMGLTMEQKQERLKQWHKGLEAIPYAKRI